MSADIRRIENISKRDIELDFMRAFSIFWVMLIHCIYWPGIIEQGVGVSLLLFEMPLIFFITGASNLYAKKRSLFNFYYRRVMRVLKPYLFYAFVVLVIHIVLKTKEVNLSFVINWILPIGKQQSFFPYLNWHLWFMPVYLLVILIMPIMIWIHEKGFIKFYYAAAILLLIFLGMKGDVFTNKYLAYYVPTVLFYSLWSTIGFEFVTIKRRREDNENMLSLLAIWTGGAIMILMYYLGLDTNWNMQEQKTPVKLMFAAYSFMSMSVFYILSPAVIAFMKLLNRNRFFRFLIDSYNKNGFSIYLFHPFLFAVLFGLFGDKLYAMSKISASAVIFVFITVTAPVLGHALGKLNIR